MTRVTLQEAQAGLADLVHGLTPGQVVTIIENDRPVAQLLPVPASPRPPRPRPPVTGTPRVGQYEGRLVVPDDFKEPLEELRFTVGKLGLGYVRQLAPLGGLAPGLGVGMTLARVPAGLEPFYGSRSPTGVQLFFRLRPVPMDSDDHVH